MRVYHETITASIGAITGRTQSEDILMMWGYGFSWGGMFLMLLGMALWIALLVVLAWAIMRWLNGITSTFTTTPHSSKKHSVL